MKVIAFRRPRRAELFLFLIIAISSIFFTEIYGQTGNFKSRIYLTRAIVDFGSFRLDEFQPKLGYDQGSYAGHVYSEKPPGSAFLMIPAYVLVARPAIHIGNKLLPRKHGHFELLTWFALVFTMAPLIGLGFVHMYRTLKLLGIGEEAYELTLLGFFSTLLFPYSTIGFSVMFAAPLLLIASYYLLRMRDNVDLVWAGLALGLVFLTKTEGAVFSVPAFLYVVLATRRFSACVVFSLAVSVSIAIQLLYNWVNFDSYLSFPIHHFAPRGILRPAATMVLPFSWPDLTRLYHMFFSPWNGLLFFSPVLALSVPGLIAIGRKNAFYAWYLGLSFIVFFAFFVGFDKWSAGANVGWRYIMCATVFLIPPMSYWISVAQKKWLCWVLIIPSVLVSLLVAVTSVWAPGKAYNPLLDWNIPQLQELGTRNFIMDMLRWHDYDNWYLSMATTSVFLLIVVFSAGVRIFCVKDE